MKIPTITREAASQLRDHELQYDVIRKQIQEEQPELMAIANGAKTPLTQTFLIGMGYVLKCLEQMPDKTPANDVQTLQDRLTRIRAVIGQDGGLCKLEAAISTIRQILDE